MPNSAKNNTLPKIVPPGPTSSVLFEAVLSYKRESRIGQLFVRSVNHPI